MIKAHLENLTDFPNFSDLLCLSRGSSSTLKTLTPFCFTLFRSPIHPPFKSASALKTQLLRFCNDSDKVASVLESHDEIQGAAFLELLRQLRPWPVLSLVVFDWRRNKALCDGVPMTAKGITISGRLKNVDLALSLFNESPKKTTSLYNALMGAYMCNGLADDCKQLFLDFNAQQRGHSSTPSVSTYNILISLYGRDTDQAITKGLQIETDGTMRSIVASYFRCNAADKLAKFMQRAISAGWKMSRSMFHGLMIMYGSQKRFKEMEDVLSEMERFNISRSKKTFCILHRVYVAAHGQEHKVNQVAGMMLKDGHDLWRREDYLKL
ncbi:predicted protein [Arabidopsis lyrata subsp. lyrata]|uniref:Predicted protein n=1 Tax=Arabidopsis lyrata subsp. lyrata TaxID=81972 RepID=D7LHE7_ARALL|nr:predicted protein [Arabidopsis lyrata subsp. lyrata]